MPVKDEIFEDVLLAFERVYAERAAYREIAQAGPNWKEEFDDLMRIDSEHMKEAAQVFVSLRERLSARSARRRYSSTLKKTLDPMIFLSLSTSDCIGHAPSVEFDTEQA
jgi:hypothetical protein